MGFPGVQAYRQQAEELGLVPPDVIFTGRTSYQKAPTWLALGDIGVAPKISATEGSGKLLNYMAMGLPTVAYDTKVSREYLGKRGVYAAPLGDSRALAQSLSLLLRNPEVGRVMGKELRERARRHFSWERTGRQLRQIYKRLWSKRSASSKR
jgi:glycosyltransferase involved in cell wall biosynthesis